jgi:hypothetical protein
MPCKQRANPPTYEVTAQDKERFRKNEEILRHLLEGCSEEEFTKLHCPVCGSALTLHVHPKLHTFTVSCSASTLHLMKHDRIAEAPAWWQSRISGGWYDDISQQPTDAQAQLGANGSQPSSTLTTRTHVAAGPRRSR